MSKHVGAGFNEFSFYKDVIVIFCLAEIFKMTENFKQDTRKHKPFHSLEIIHLRHQFIVFFWETGRDLKAPTLATLAVGLNI